LAQISPIVQHPPAALEQALQRLGRNIRTARLRRRWRLEDVAERMFYFAIAGGRTIADPIYAYGIMSMIFFLIFLERKKNGNIFEGPPVNNLCAWAAGTIILVDLSRPYGIFAVAIFMISVIRIAGRRLNNLKLSIRIVSLFSGCLLLLAPYHINQFSYTGSIVLSNWSGCNLVEVFPFPSALKYVTELEGRAKQDQVKSASICKDAQAEVISSIKQHPFQAIAYLLRPRRLVKLIGPWGVFQYSGIKNLMWTIPLFSGPIFFSWVACLWVFKRRWSMSFLLHRC
jgi:hypothetical protein